MIIDCHMHTPLCGHASGSPTEYVQWAARKGLQLVTFTCHIPMDMGGFGNYGIRMKEKHLPKYFKIVEQARTVGERLGVEVLCGIEAEIFPDEQVMARMDQTLAAHDFDFILGSLHHFTSSYGNRLRTADARTDFEKVETYFEDLATGARTGRYHSISHPDVIRIYGTVDHFDPAEHEKSIRRFLQSVIEADICMEVNTSGFIKECAQMHPDPLILDWASEMGVNLTIGSDSHNPQSVGQFYEIVLPLLKEKDFTQLHYHRAGKRVAVPIEG